VTKIEKLVLAYNEQMDEEMQCSETQEDWFTLWIDNEEITEGDFFDMKERIEGICKENGVDMWEEQ